MTQGDHLAALFIYLRQHRDADLANHERIEAWDFLNFCLKNQHYSSSQLFQDLFVLFTLRERQRGFFVEFGVCDGLTLSNTLLLESSYGWRGIIAEPASCWHDRLKRNRTCAISTACVWSESGVALSFNQTNEPELSTINQFSDRDSHAVAREGGNQYQVDTLSLLDLLVKYEAPKTIDYLSIDTEGSELAILEAFDFSKYDIKIITVEHNFTPQREAICALLSRNGYTNKFTQFSAFDDWYVKA